MMPPSRPHSRRWIRQRMRNAPAALYALAGTLGVMALAFAAWGWAVARRYDDQLLRVTSAQAELLGREFADDVRLLIERSWRTFTPVSREAFPWTRGIAGRMSAAVDSAVQCSCQPVIPNSGGTFAWNSMRPDELEVDGIPPERVDPIRRMAARFGEQPYGTGQVILKVDGDGNEIVAPTFYRADRGIVEVVGYVSTPSLLSDALFDTLAAVVQRNRFGDMGPRVVAWRVIAPGGDTVMSRGTVDPGVPLVSVAFIRPRFQADSTGVVDNLIGPPPTTRRVPAPDGRPDPRNEPFRLAVQVHPAVIGELLYGTSRGPAWPLGVLVAVTLGLAMATLFLAGRFVRQVREREAFATAVAHDLRTPLTQILLYAESLQLGRPAMRAREEAANIIVRETRRLIHLVENALDFVREGSGHRSLRLETLDVVAVARETVTGLMPVAAKSGATLEFRGDARALADANHDAVAQILINLIDNAIRYGPAGQCVTTTVTARGDGVDVTVDDQGPGIPAAKRERMFEPFVRGDSTGMGIGLAVSRRLVQLMGGSLHAETAPAGGTRFVLTLPVTDASSAGEPVLASGAAS